MADEPNVTIVIKKIKKAAHGHHGGAWKVAYADFVTAMMAFFLVMWIVAMSQPTKEGIQKYFNEPVSYLFGADKAFMGVFNGSEGAQMVTTAKKGGLSDNDKLGGVSRVHLLAKSIENGMDSFKSEISEFKVSPDRIQFAITAQSLFSPGAVLLKPEAEPLLNRIADLLKDVDANIQIEAHTDDLPPDSPQFETNWELSALRAATVVRYFIEGHHFDPSKLQAMGAGQYKPVADNRTPEGRSKNRRIDVYVIPIPHEHLTYRGTAAEEPDPAEDAKKE